MRELSCRFETVNPVGPDGYRFNIGPPIRTERVPVKATIFGDDELTINWPFVERVGIDFQGASPLTVVEDAMTSLSIENCDDLRSRFMIPSAVLACRTIEEDGRFPKLGDLTPEQILRHALILGLCSSALYDPHRAIIFTNNRLGRKLGLYATGGFYANH